MEVRSCNIVQLADSGCTCKLFCSHCAACVHMYTCSCIDSAIHNTVCKHSHLVHMERKATDEDERNGTDENERKATDEDERNGTDEDGSPDTVEPVQLPDHMQYMYF